MNLRKGDIVFLMLGIIILVVHVVGVLLIIVEYTELNNMFDIGGMVAEGISSLLLFVGLPWVVYDRLSKRKEKSKKITKN